MNSKKASEEQKMFLINYMVANIDFGNDKFESVDGAHTKTEKWDELAVKLNSLRGASKDGRKWRKFWMDQKIHVKERAALHKASFERSGINGPKKLKEISEYENRILQLMVPAVVAGNDEVNEMFFKAENVMAYEMNEEWLIETEEPVTTTPTTNTTANTTTNNNNIITMSTTNKSNYRKRKSHPSGKTPNEDIEKQLIDIEKEKLEYKKKTYMLDESKFEESKKFRLKYLEIRKSELEIRNRELDIRNRELDLKERELVLKEKTINNM